MRNMKFKKMVESYVRKINEDNGSGNSSGNHSWVYFTEKQLNRSTGFPVLQKALKNKDIYTAWLKPEVDVDSMESEDAARMLKNGYYVIFSSNPLTKEILKDIKNDELDLSMEVDYDADLTSSEYHI